MTKSTTGPHFDHNQCVHDLPAVDTTACSGIGSLTLEKEQCWYETPPLLPSLAAGVMIKSTLIDQVHFRSNNDRILHWPSIDFELAGTTCVDASYKTLVDSPSAYMNRTIYTEMEMFIPVEYTVQAVRDFIAYQDKVKPLHHDRRGGLYTQVYWGETCLQKTQLFTCAFR